MPKGTLYTDSPEYKAPGGKLTFRKYSEHCYVWESTGGWVTTIVRYIPYEFKGPIPGVSDEKTKRMQQGANKWEITVNLVYISRDKGVYFNQLDTALLACEKVVEKIIADLRKDLGQ